MGKNNKRMKLLRTTLPGRMRPRSIFFFSRYLRARVHGANAVCAQIFAGLYTFTILYSGVENVHRFNPAGNPKKARLVAGVYSDEPRDIFAISNRSSSVRSTERSRDA